MYVRDSYKSSWVRNLHHVWCFIKPLKVIMITAHGVLLPPLSPKPYDDHRTEMITTMIAKNHSMITIFPNDNLLRPASIDSPRSVGFWWSLVV